MAAGRPADQVVEKLIEAVKNLTEKNGPGASPSANAGTSNVEETMKRLFPSTRGSSDKFNPNSSYVPKRRANNSSTFTSTSRAVKRKASERSVTCKPTLKDVILLPSPKIENVPRGQFREYLYSEGFAESAVFITDDMNEDNIRDKFNDVFRDKLELLADPKFTFVRAIGNRIINVKNGPYTGTLLKHISKQGPLYIRSTINACEEDVLKNWVEVKKPMEDEKSSDDEMFMKSAFYDKNFKGKEKKVIQIHDVDDEYDDEPTLITASRTSASFSTSNRESNKPWNTYANYCNIMSEDTILDSDDDDENLQMGIAHSLSTCDHNKEWCDNKENIRVMHQQQDASSRTRLFLTKLQDSGSMDAIVSEAKKEAAQLDDSFGGGGKSGLPQFMIEHTKSSNKPHVEACKILASAKDEELSTIQDHLLTFYPDTFSWSNNDKMKLKGHVMTMATSSILNKINEVEKHDLKKKSASDILKEIQLKSELEEDLQVIRVRRNHIWEDALRAFQKSSFNFEKLLRVNFIGEEAEDARGPRREFLRLLMKEIAEISGILEGPPNHKVTTANPLLVVKKVYFYAGIMVSTSLKQGGPGMCCLSPTIYSYISNQPVNATIEDVADYTAKANIEKIQNAEENQFAEIVKELAHFLIECGLSKLAWTYEEKQCLVKVLCSHFLLHRSKIAIDQFMEGLKVGGLLEHIQKFPLSMKDLFTYSDIDINVEKFRSLLKFNFSPIGANTREAEEMAVLWWEEYLDEVNDPTSDLNQDTLRELLIFTTGAEQIPPCGFEKQIDICFYNAHDAGNPNVCRLPYASTCSMTLYLPLGMESFTEFKTLIGKSLGGYGGFGSV